MLKGDCTHTKARCWLVDETGGKALSRCSLLLAIKACCALVRLCAAAFVEPSSNHKKTLTWDIKAFLGKGLCDPGWISCRRRRGTCFTRGRALRSRRRRRTTHTEEMAETRRKRRRRDRRGKRDGSSAPKRRGIGRYARRKFCPTRRGLFFCF